MMWRNLFFTAGLVLSALLAACSNSGHGTTAVTIAISSNSGVHNKPGIGLRSKAMNPVTVVRITISGPGMDTMTKDIPVLSPQTVSQTFYVKNGPRRTFLIEALDASNAVIYRGSSTADLNGTPVTISLPLQTMLFNNLITTPWNDEARTIAQAEDGNGDLIIAGHTFGDLGGPNADATHRTPDLFVSKLTPTGATIWKKQFGTSAFDICYSAATDSMGNIYLTGSTGGDLNGTAKAGFIDGYVMKLDPAGNVLWTSLTGTVLTNTFSNAIVVDNAGNAYLTGYTDGDLSDQRAGNAGMFDIFTAKYDPAGTLVWIRQDGSSGDDYGNGIAYSPGAAGPDALYITGSTYGDLNGNTNADTVSPGSTTDFFLLKYDSAGNRQWTYQSGTVDASADDDALAVAVDPLSGGIYVAGGTTGALASGLTGSADLFVAKFDAQGNASWLQPQQRGAVGSSTIANAIAVYPNAGIVVTGTTDGNLDQLGNAGLRDLFMVEYDLNGYPGNLQQFGTKADDDGTGIVIDNNGIITIVGNTYGGFTSSATEDIFLQQYTWVAPLVP